MKTIKGTVLSAGAPRVIRGGVKQIFVTLESDGRERSFLVAWSDGCDGFEHLVKGSYLELHVEKGAPRDIVRYAKIAEREIVIDGQTVTVEQDSLF